MQIYCNEQKHLDKRGVKTSTGLAWYTNIADVSLSWNITMAFVRSCESALYHINTNEIPGELSRENLISSHVKILPLVWQSVKILPFLFLLASTVKPPT